MQNHISDMIKIKDMVKSKNTNADLEETILETIEGCIENAKSHLKTEKQQIFDVSKYTLEKCDTPRNGSLIGFFEEVYNKVTKF